MQLFTRRKKSATSATQRGSLFEAVSDAMAEVRAYAQSHGGSIDLIEVSEDGVVSIRFAGACRGCPLSGMTLKLGIEEQLKLRVTGVKKVVSV